MKKEDEHKKDSKKDKKSHKKEEDSDVEDLDDEYVEIKQDKHKSHHRDSKGQE